jgi:hypothetical protein
VILYAAGILYRNADLSLKCAAAVERGQGMNCGAALVLTGEARILRRDMSKVLMYSTNIGTCTHYIAQYAESASTSGEDEQKPVKDRTSLD